MSRNSFTINKAYAENALEKRSMFQRDFTVLLMYFATLANNNVPEDLKAIHSVIGQAGFKDLIWKLPNTFSPKPSINRS